jgi:1-acyl-sn-glycerol-3-phosphate acyltransferase
MKNTPGPLKILYILHTILIFVWTVLATIVLGTAAILISFFSKNGDAVHLVARAWGRSILWVSGICVTVRGFNREWVKRPNIFMSNHQSNYDIPVLLSALPAQFRWLAKAELFKIPIFGSSMRGAGAISIDRSNRKSAFASLNQAAKMIRSGTSVMIFPEGTRSDDGRLLSFKKGGFVLAVDAGVPIVPIVITGTHEIMPKGRLLIRFRKVRIDVGPIIQSSDYTRKNKDDLMACVRKAMLRNHCVPPKGGDGG